MILNNCIITHDNSEVLKFYDVSTSTDIFHTGVDIIADSIYTPCNGVCIYNGLIDNQPSCTIQYSQNVCLRFSHLKEVIVNQGQLVSYNQQIGTADKYVHFEYLTSERGYPYFRVFFNANRSYFMYKHDPMLVLSGNTIFDNKDIAPKPARYYVALMEDGRAPEELGR